MTIRNLEHMFSPRSVVLIGASRRNGSVGHWLARDLAEGFKGHVDFVNPKGGTIEGKSCHRRLSRVKAPADLAVIVTPPGTVPASLRNWARRARARP